MAALCSLHRVESQGPSNRNAGSSTSRFQREGMNIPPVIGLFAMHRASVAVKTLVGIGIDAGVVDHQHAGVFQPHPDETGEIEHCMALARGGNEKHRMLGIRLDEALDEFA